MEQSQPVGRTLKVLEYFAGRETPVATLAEISADLKIAPATLGRIIRTLAQAGYISYTGRKGYVANFRVSRYLPMPSVYLQHLNRVVQELTDHTRQSAEVITHEAGDLYWYSKKEHPSLQVVIRAQPGFRRTIKELDAPSRLVLAAMDKEERCARYDTSSFYMTGALKKPVSAEEFEAVIATTDPRKVEYDLYGNEFGIRRFAKLISDRNGKPLHLLCIAEAALMNHDLQAHTARNVAFLERQGADLQQLVGRLASVGDGDGRETDFPREEVA